MLINFSLFSKKQPEQAKEIPAASSEETKTEEDLNNKTIDVRSLNE